MSRTENSELVAAVAGLLHTSLKPIGFRKRRHAWNRVGGDGVVQYIGLQMAEYVPPPARTMPDDASWRSFSSSFTVNIGLWFEEAAALHSFATSPSFVSYPTVSVRLGELMDVSKDVWWPLVGTPDDVVLEIAPPIEKLAVPWLERFASRSEILASPRHGSPWVSTPERAAIAIHEGQIEMARGLFLADLADERCHPAYRANIPKLAARLGISLDQT